jgi:glycosyltransferase involved in cell wall biosynthesis
MKSSNKGVAMFSLFFEPLSMGGSEMQAKRLSKELLKMGMDVIIVTSGNKSLPTFEVIDGIKIYRFISFKSRFKKTKNTLIQEKEVVFDYSDKEGKDLIYTHKSNTSIKQFIFLIDILLNAFITFWKLRKQFSVIQINTVSYMAFFGSLIGHLLGKKVIVKDSTMDGIIQMQDTPFPSFARKYIISHVDLFIAMTCVIAENYRKVGVPENKIKMIPNGIDTENSLPETVRSGRGKCLFVGNLYQQPAKGVDILLKAWPDVLRVIPSATLTIVGDGNIAKYRQYVEMQGLSASVVFTGKQNPRDYYLSHDLFVLPSRREGMSNALIEAMLYAMPVVATDISGNQDLITDKGGRLVVPNNADSLSAAIVEMLKQPTLLPAMGQHNRDCIMRLCSLSRVAELYSECYKEL